MASKFDSLIEQARLEINEKRPLGTWFEQIVVAYLKNEPAYQNRFKNVWMLAEVPEEFGISRKDTGVDIVAENVDGTLTAVQAKFYEGKVGKDTINSYIADMNKAYYEDGLLISTSDEWNQNALETIREQSKNIQLIGLSDLRSSSVDWDQFKFDTKNLGIVKSKKQIRDYQSKAIDAAIQYYENNDRGMLIMAPGTGKTFTSLKIAEELARKSQKDTFFVLYLVPSIQLLSQTLFGWNSDISDEFEMNSFAVTSDRGASQKKTDSEDLLPIDIGFPATTKSEEIIRNYESLPEKTERPQFTVIFSTYQSIDRIQEAQNLGYPDFDLIIADEAHRTTGFNQSGQEESTFRKVHSNENVRGKLRLYQTATPRIYGEDAKTKGEEKSVVIDSMDDETRFGKEFFRLGFGEAVQRGILTDYKVVVLAVDQKTIQKDMQQTLADDNGLNIDDVGRIIGVWNGMMKRESFSDKVEGRPMKRAIAFSDKIVNSKKIADEFNTVVNEYLGAWAGESFSVDVHHVDGGMNAIKKKEELDWLAGDMPDNHARVLSNVKFLTEGIDVPNLDAVIFFAPKKSQVDIVQAVGRIMRKYEDKEYGYIILPIVIPEGTTPENVLDDNKTYDAVWQVLNALRSTDERFNAMVNQLELNNKKPKNFDVIGHGAAPSTELDEDSYDKQHEGEEPQYRQIELAYDWDAVENAIYGKVVRKVGNRRYLEDWSKDVNEIAQRYISWINTRLEDKQDPIAVEFGQFVKSLQYNINSSIDQGQAVEMLAQHLITKPVFEALFDEYSFVNNNPVSTAMEKIIVELEKAGFAKEQEKLAPFYESVKMRASGVDNAAGKQKIIVTLYDKFFSTGFKETTERLGIVFTPIEVVDFIVKSVEDTLKLHFNKSLSDTNVHILDPFTGTGTFIVRTLEFLKQKLAKGELSLEDVLYKYMHELHANEIILLSYYIAAINIEATFDEVNGDDMGYVPFEGIVLTDTFESTEKANEFQDDFFGTNNKRLIEQQKDPITVIIGNPPYSSGQNSANEDNANVHYPVLEQHIRDTYMKLSNSGAKNTLQDSYIQAVRWATDRLDDKGVIGFVTNGSYVDSRGADGLRASLYRDFNHLYIFNLRGDQRTVGELSRKEGGKIFGSGSRTPISISILVKDGSEQHELHYYDIGDYLSRDEKLAILNEKESLSSVQWSTINPDQNNDWINQRDKDYESYPSLDGDAFNKRAIGIGTKRDSWVSGFSREAVISNANKMAENFNSELNRVDDVSDINLDEAFVKWSDRLKNRFKANKTISLDEQNVVQVMYRPFTKKYLYYQDEIVDRPGPFSKMFGESNEIIYVTKGAKVGSFASLVLNVLPMEVMLGGSGTGFALYDHSQNNLFGTDSNMGDEFLSKFESEQDAVAYIYAVLNSPEYQQKYANDLSKDLPRIPLLVGKENYIEIGKQLIELHLNYEIQDKLPDVQVEITGDAPSYTVKKMKHPKRGQLDTIIYNSDITIKNIPEDAYKYVINGRPAVEWVIDQYQVKTEKKSGITDDPNLYSDQTDYILNLLLSVITLAVKTNELLEQLPEFKTQS